MAKRDEKRLSEIGRFFFPFLGKDCGVWWRLWKQKDKNLCKARTWHARAKNALSKVKTPSISENSKRIRAKVKYRPTFLIGFAANAGSSTTSRKHLVCIYKDHGLRFVGLDFWFQHQHQALTAGLQLTQHKWRIPTFWKPYFAEITAYQKIIADLRDFFSLWGFCLPYIIGGMTTHCHRLSSQTGNLRGRRKEWQDVGTTYAVQFSLLLSLPYFLLSH